MTGNVMLVTGANGFVGRAVVAGLALRGHKVRGVRRRHAMLTVDGVSAAVIAGIDGETDWSSALDGVGTVIHLAARVHVMRERVADPISEFRRVNVAGTEHLARSAAASGVKRFVFVSSIKVNGEETPGGWKFSELDRPSPQDPYGISKWEAEQALHRVAQETGLEVVIVRPPLVYGPGVKGNFIQLLKVLRFGVPLPFASICNRRDLIYVENLADVLIACATHPAAAGQTYLVCDGEALSTPELLRLLAAGIGRPARLLRCPPHWLSGLGWLLGKSQQMERLLGSLQIDSGKIRHELNWMPPYTVGQGLQATADWYRTKTR